MQMVPEYYIIDATTGEMFPADVYIKYGSSYKPVNIWGLATGEDEYTWGEGGSGYDINSIYNYVITLDWDDESARRQYTIAERYMTESLAQDDYVTVSSAGSYILGNSQLEQVNGNARTFIGGETTYGELMNYTRINNNLTPYGGINNSKATYNATTEITSNLTGGIDADEWWSHAQRWHMTIALPTSSIFLKAGESITSANITKYNENPNYYVVCTVSYRAMGDVWNLAYYQENGTVDLTKYDNSGNKLGNVTYDIPESITINGYVHKVPTAIAIYGIASDSVSGDYDVIENH
jgi:hypothetical protein